MQFSQEYISITSIVVGNFVYYVKTLNSRRILFFYYFLGGGVIENFVIECIFMSVKLQVVIS